MNIVMSLITIHFISFSQNMSYALYTCIYTMIMEVGDNLMTDSDT